ncbi:MAG: helix-turn-helix domain-containing protein [Acidimicrobiales bacterium]
MTGPVKRSYDSSRRRDQARRTRARVVASATELFVDRGYGATSIAAIADHAGVSPQTVYAAFGTKAALLGEAVGVAMAGDDEPVAIMDRPEIQAALQVDDPRRAAEAFAGHAAALLERAGRILHAADAAAEQDPDLAALWKQGHTHRLTDMRRVAEAFDAQGLLRPELGAEAVADALWALASPDAYRSFTVIRGWTTRRYERWLAAAVQALLVPPAAAG